MLHRERDALREQVLRDATKGNRKFVESLAKKAAPFLVFYQRGFSQGTIKFLLREDIKSPEQLLVA